MELENEFKEIMEYAHFWNWLPDWDLAKKIYIEFPDLILCCYHLLIHIWKR